MRTDVIYVNVEIQDDTAIGRLMHDMFCENPDDMYYAELAERSRYFKKDEHGVMKMCETMEELRAESFDKGFSEGHLKGVTEMTWTFVRNLLKDHDMPYEKIAEKANTTVDEVIKIANESGLSY